MILADTMIWSRHFRRGDRGLQQLLRKRQIVVHPWIIGELALGAGVVSERLDDLRALPAAPVISDRALFEFVSLHAVRGIGWVDLQLLTSALATRSPIWTDDHELRSQAQRFEIAAALA